MSNFSEERPGLLYTFSLAGVGGLNLYARVAHGEIGFNAMGTRRTDDRWVSAPLDPVETLVRAWYAGDGSPLVVADAVEESLGTADAVARAQWLLRLLRGDPEWRASILPDFRSLYLQSPPPTPWHVGEPLFSQLWHVGDGTPHGLGAVPIDVRELTGADRVNEMGDFLVTALRGLERNFSVRRESLAFVTNRDTVAGLNRAYATFSNVGYFYGVRVEYEDRLPLGLMYLVPASRLES